MTNISEIPNGAHDILLDEHALARRWSISAKTLQNRRVVGGFVPFVKISSTVRYRLSDVIAWEVANVRQSTSDGGCNG